MANPVRISAAIITLNEAKNIQRCLDSLVGVVDEVVVVDSGSTDETEAICRAHSLAPRFLFNAWPGHVEQKTYATAQATHDIILSLDADEALSPELHASVAQAKQDWQADGYTLNRLTNYVGHWVRHGGWYPDRKLRLFDRRKAGWAGTNPHDFVQPGPDTRLRHLQGDLLHYSFYSIADHLRIVDKYTDIGAQELLRKGPKPGAGTWVKLFVSPGFKFLRDYLIRSGFRDGLSGLIIAQTSAYATFLKYAKYLRLARQGK